MSTRILAVFLVLLSALVVGFGKETPDPPLGGFFSTSETGELFVVFNRVVAYEKVPGRRRTKRSKKTFAVKVEPEMKWSAPISWENTVWNLGLDQNATKKKEESVWIQTADDRRAFCDGGVCEIDTENGFMPKAKGRRIRMSFNGHVSTLMTLKNKPASPVTVWVFETEDGTTRGVRMHLRYERSMCSPYDHEVLIVVDKNGHKRWVYEGYVDSNHDLIEKPPVQHLLPELA